MFSDRTTRFPCAYKNGIPWNGLVRNPEKISFGKHVSNHINICCFFKKEKIYTSTKIMYIAHYLIITITLKALLKKRNYTGMRKKL